MKDTTGRHSSIGLVVETVTRVLRYPMDFTSLLYAVENDYGSLSERTLYRALRRMRQECLLKKVGHVGNSPIYVRPTSFWAQRADTDLTELTASDKDNGRLTALLNRYAKQLRQAELKKSKERHR